MENKPVFCSECGAKLTGSAQFCASCGAKQEEAAAVEVAPFSPAPDNSLATPKAKISVFGLILAIAAVLLTFATELTQMVAVASQAAYGRFSFEAFVSYLRNPGYYTGLLTAWVVPVVAVVMVIIKKKPAALVGLILAGLSLLVQFIVAVAYSKLMRGHIPALFRVLPIPVNTLFYMVNGEGLLETLRRIAATKSLWTAYGLNSVFTVLGYYLKNILAAVACLLVATKKTK